MKKAFISFIHKPVLVTVLSLVIAGGIGGYEYHKYQAAPTYQFVQAQAGSISTAGTAVNGIQHVGMSFVSSGRVKSVSAKVGDVVKKGAVLATLDPESTLGAITQAQAAYDAAQANFEKIVRGATAETINVAKTSVDKAQQSIAQLVENAPTQIDSMMRTSIDNMYRNANTNSPEFVVSFYDSTLSTNVNLTPADTNVRLDLARERVEIGMLISAWKPTSPEVTLANLNKVKAYLADVSAGLNNVYYDTKYQANVDKYKSNVATARATVDTLINNIQNAQLAIDTANKNVAVVTTSARPEDISAAKAQVNNALGALEIAQAAYNGRIITAPGDATVTAVHINVGEIAGSNFSAIELSGANFAKDVAVMVPRDTLSERNGKMFVLVQTTTGVEEREVTVGASDNQNVEIVSGLQAGDMVALIN